MRHRHPMSSRTERRPLRVAFLAYRGNPYCGGQGVYTRHLTRELVALGHEVTVFGGPPYPVLDDGVELVPVPSLDLYREPDPFRTPRLREFRSLVDVVEFAVMCTAGFPEPLTFSLRARRALASRPGAFDVVHDNQSLGSGLLGMLDDGWPVLATVHHPIAVDRALEMAGAPDRWRRLTLRRWYGFVRMQARVARRLPSILTVSESSRADVVTHLGVHPGQISVVPVGVDHARFRPQPEVARVPGRLVTTASADVAMKGLVPLLEALAKVRTERHAELVVVGAPRRQSGAVATIERLGLEGAVRFVTGLSDAALVHLYAEAELAVVPSLYEGFSLPAVEAMACGVPVVATTGGALPEVVGRHGETALLVPPGDVGAMAAAIGRALEGEAMRRRLGRAGRARTVERFTWQATAEATARQYRLLLERSRPAGPFRR